MTDFVETLASAITVRQLATPISRATVLPLSIPQSEAVAVLDGDDFDFAPVADGDTITGRVAKADLDAESGEPLADHVTPLHERIIVSAGSPIDLVVEWFAHEPFLLVLDGRDVVGLVTVSDLNKQAARTYLYALIAGFEMALANLLRVAIEDQESILPYCSEERRKAILADYAAAEDQEVDYIAAMNLSDLLNVAQRTELAARLGYTSHTSWRRATGHLVGFRNQVAHPTRPIVRTNADIDRVGRAVRSLRMLYRAVVQITTTDPAGLAN